MKSRAALLQEGKEMKKKPLNGRRLFAGLVSALLVLTMLCPAFALAAEPERKTVRVGYVNALNYEEGGEGEYKRGSGYEYLQKLSYLTGWKYEYVYGSFADCLEMLKKGEIDLFGNISYTPERAEVIDFASYPQGKDIYFLYTSKEHEELTLGDLTRLNGCTIGVTAGSYQAGLLTKWLADNHIEAAIQPCTGYDALMNGLKDGTLDAIATPDLSVNYDCISITNIGFSEYYFAVSKSRPDLLSELNEALYEIQNTEQDYNNQLVNRYYNRMSSVLLLNQKEKAWLDEHDNTIRFGYVVDDLPFCGEENGELVGVMRTIADTLEHEFGITVETVPFPAQPQLTEAIASGEIDVGGPVLSDFYLAEQSGTVLTNSIIDTTPLILFSEKNSDDFLRVIATTEAGVFNSSVISILFPEAELYPCDSQEDCLKAVASGKATGTVIPSSRLNILRSNPAMDKLTLAEIASKAQIALASSMENRRAVSIVNKGISLSSDLLSGAVLAQHSISENKLSVVDFIRAHAFFVISIALLIITILGVLIYRLFVGQKKLVHALEAAQSANIAKTTFLNNMSHDIRTPMNAIIGFTNIAAKQNSSPEVQRCLQKIEDSSEHLLTLINDVLDISRIESGRIKCNPVPVDITAVTDTVASITSGFLVDRDLNFQIRRIKPPHPYVLADVVRLREILVNILGNAVKFTPDGGTIMLETDYRPGSDAQHIVMRYRISDTGIGMSEAFLKHIFDEFAQEDTGARTQYKGTGLGMAITKHYVELMGGTITAESKKGVGSVFTVEVPLALTAPENVCRQDTLDAQTDLSGVKVLMAEDNDLNAEIAATQLSGCGITVTRAVDGQQAVEIFSEQPAGSFDLILMDIMMPRMDGYAAARAIRTLKDRPDGRTIPIIAVTANAFSEDMQASLDAGMNDHLSKPIAVDELVRTIVRNLRR